MSHRHPDARPSSSGTGGPPSGDRAGTPLPSIDGAPVRLIRSARRTLAVEISRDAEVLIRAPLRCPMDRIRSLLDAREGWIREHLAVQRERMARRPPDPTPEELRALKERARERILPRVAYWSAVTGLVPSGIRIGSARTRWGSCGPTDRITFSCFLARCPDEAVDLVVVHELCHLRHRDHGPAFYALLSRWIPDHRERRRLLDAPFLSRD